MAWRTMKNRRQRKKRTKAGGARSDAGDVLFQTRRMGKVKVAVGVGGVRIPFKFDVETCSLSFLLIADLPI
jgi:hypothetical protein